MLFLWTVFGFIYWIPISFQRKASASAIYRVLPKDRIGVTRCGLGFLEPQVKRVSASPIPGLIYAFQFSALSAFQIGWKEFTVGSWLTRIQRSEYSLTSKGWVRSASGIQAIVSVYLMVLAILSYFGRPFS
jgi:hypothetical protein